MEFLIIYLKIFLGMANCEMNIHTTRTYCDRQTDSFLYENFLTSGGDLKTRFLKS